MIFDDVTDEFCQTSLILKRFEMWRQRDRSSYTNTYFSLCLPKVCMHQMAHVVGLVKMSKSERGVEK